MYTHMLYTCTCTHIYRMKPDTDNEEDPEIVAAAKQHFKRGVYVNVVGLALAIALHMLYAAPSVLAAVSPPPPPPPHPPPPFGSVAHFSHPWAAAVGLYGVRSDPWSSQALLLSAYPSIVAALMLTYQGTLRATSPFEDGMPFLLGGASMYAAFATLVAAARSKLLSPALGPTAVATFGPEALLGAFDGLRSDWALTQVSLLSLWILLAAAILLALTAVAFALRGLVRDNLPLHVPAIKKFVLASLVLLALSSTATVCVQHVSIPPIMSPPSPPAPPIPPRCPPCRRRQRGRLQRHQVHLYPALSRNHHLPRAHLHLQPHQIHRHRLLSRHCRLRPPRCHHAHQRRRCPPPRRHHPRRRGMSTPLIWRSSYCHSGSSSF